MKLNIIPKNGSTYFQSTMVEVPPHSRTLNIMMEKIFCQLQYTQFYFTEHKIFCSSSGGYIPQTFITSSQKSITHSIPSASVFPNYFFCNSGMPNICWAKEVRRLLMHGPVSNTELISNFWSSSFYEEPFTPLRPMDFILVPDGCLPHIMNYTIEKHLPDLIKVRDNSLYIRDLMDAHKWTKNENLNLLTT